MIEVTIFNEMPTIDFLSTGNIEFKFDETVEDLEKMKTNFLELLYLSLSQNKTILINYKENQKNVGLREND